MLVKITTTFDESTKQKFVQFLKVWPSVKSITDNLRAENGISRWGLCRKWSPSEDWTTFNQISIGSPARLLPQPALLFRVISGNICMSCWTSICQTRPIYTACMSENSCSLCQLTMTEITSFQKLLWFRNPIFKVQHQLAKGRYVCKKNNILLTFSPHCL